MDEQVLPNDSRPGKREGSSWVGFIQIHELNAYSCAGKIVKKWLLANENLLIGDMGKLQRELSLTWEREADNL